MDPTKTEPPKLPAMVMCGDHPSFTKTELNAKEPADKELPIPLPLARLSTSSAHSERTQRVNARSSAHALRTVRRASRSAVAGDPRGHSGALVQALGSFRWPPYLLTVWVLVLVLTHALHCLVGGLERALPRIRRLCEYLHSSAERQWRGERGRVAPAALAALAALAYLAYAALYVAYSVALWSIEPLSTDDKVASMETKVTDYDEASKSDASLK